MIKYFSRNLHSDRLVLKHLVPNLQNAKMIYDVLKNENPKDYKYEPLVPKHVLPKSVKETLNMMNHYKDFEDKDGCVFYMFYNNEFIGVRKLCYFKEASTLKFSTVWLIRSARRKGFAKESFRLLEDIAFNKLKVNRISRVNIKENKDYLFFQGIQTKEKDMPTDNGVKYSGNAVAYRIADRALDKGTVEFTANFKDKKMSGSIKLDNFGTLKYDTISIEENEFHGSQWDGKIANKIQGSFYGAKAAEMAGGFDGQGIKGTFGAKKQSK